MAISEWMFLLPSGNLLQFAIENGHLFIYSWFTHE